MKIPKSIKIGHQRFKVKEKSGLKSDGKDVWGLTEFDNNLIWLEKSLKDTQKKDVLMHELMHTVLQFIGERETTTQYQDERLTESLANVLRMVFAENKLLIGLFK